VQLIGVSLDNGFQILREVAKGAQSRVYVISDGAQVKAAKVFPKAHADRAAKEYAYGHRLKHPHINTVEAYLTIAGYAAVIMPLVRGERLGSYLAQAALGDFLETFAGVLQALGYLHDQHIIHRDIKPENIIVDATGFAKLLDFDLAASVSEIQRRRAIVGTVAYLSPEQARSEPATFASDLYGAGVILYRGLTGQVPFSGSVTEVLASHRHQPAPLPSQRNQQLRPFDAVITQALAKDPQQRFGNARAMLSAVKQAQSALCASLLKQRPEAAT
jgi:serine/threonine protein kinase